jgi:hypothetical protein
MTCHTNFHLLGYSHTFLLNAVWHPLLLLLQAWQWEESLVRTMLLISKHSGMPCTLELSGRSRDDRRLAKPSWEYVRAATAELWHHSADT